MSDSLQPSSEQEPLACLIQDPQQMKQRMDEVEELFKQATGRQELADGYAFSFPGDDAWVARLVDFIQFEKNCCPFFTFELIFEPQHGPLWLRLRGPEEARATLQTIIAATGAGS